MLLKTNNTLSPIIVCVPKFIQQLQAKKNLWNKLKQKKSNFLSYFKNTKQLWTLLPNVSDSFPDVPAAVDQVWEVNTHV